MSEKTMIEAIRECLGQEMEADNRVVVIGEDVGVLGGVFRALMVCKPALVKNVLLTCHLPKV